MDVIREESTGLRHRGQRSRHTLFQSARLGGAWCTFRLRGLPISTRWARLIGRLRLLAQHRVTTNGKCLPE
ncbi:hypothetical protein TELCIR_14523 [Teladorsagia circumcincta]|uniref:Uncharacterized protein n=1 Tax=Teladorsagia circumcincta TaxID=45464 RepID=A0A2G9U0V7_TELCI|nr:hypothetical protein TELCIR_14523 [Teladorsagia circumcincta]